MQLMWPFQRVLQGLVAVQVKVEYTLGQWKGLLAMGFWWLGQWQWGSIPWEMVSKQALWVHPLPLFHCTPQSALGRFLLSSPMAHTLHMIVGHPTFPKELLLVPLSIPPEAAVELVHPK